MSYGREELLCIDIAGVVVRRESAGPGWQAHVEGQPGEWERGATKDAAVGALIRRLAIEHQGANHRRALALGSRPEEVSQ